MMARGGKYCSFCGRSVQEAGQLINGNGVSICRDCVETCRTLFSSQYGEEEKNDDTFLQSDIPSPREIKEYLDEYVIGQDAAKRVLSVAVYNHYKRVLHQREIEEAGVELDKSNILLVGPTGTGKTLLARTLAKKLKVPFAIADATTLTEAGYVGEDVENILLKLIDAADFDIAKAEKGIIFIDEIDKIAKKGENVSITRDVSGEGVQQALLKIIEGTVASVPPQGGRKHPNQEMLKIDTKNILFICGGAFEGIEKKIAQRLNTRVVGYGAQEKKSHIDRDNLLRYIAPQDLRAYGLIPEIVGRLPIVTYLNPLDRDALRRILTEPKNALVRQYVHLFELDGVKLTIEPAVLDMIVDTALKYKLGARGLRSICEAIMMDPMYDLPGSGRKTFKITADYARERIERFAGTLQ